MDDDNLTKSNEDDLRVQHLIRNEEPQVISTFRYTFISKVEGKSIFRS